MAKKKTNKPTAPAPSRRAQLQAEKEAAARKSRHRVIIVVSCVVVLILGLTGVVLLNSQPTSTPAAPPVSTSSAPGTSQTPTFIPPDGTDQMAWIEAKSPSAKPDALVVDEHIDYQCSFCELADRFFGSSMKTLVDRGDIIWRVHIRTLVGDGIVYNDSSLRAGMAATCADVAGGSAAFLSYHETVFANQPAEGVGYTDQQLRVDFPAQAGITGAALSTLQSCYDTGQTTAYVQSMEQVNWNSTTINGSEQDPVHGTPAFFVNGHPMLFGDMLATTKDENGNSVYIPGIDPSPDGLLAYMKNIAE